MKHHYKPVGRGARGARTSAAARFGFIVVAACLGIAALAGAAQAQQAPSTAPVARASGYHIYCNSLVQPRTPCSTSYTATIYLNVVWYSGAGTVSVCERAVAIGNGSTVSRRCENNLAGSGSDLDFYDEHGYEVLATCGNNSAYAHTIECEGDY